MTEFFDFIREQSCRLPNDHHDRRRNTVRHAGAFFTISDKPDGPIVICEGVATGLSVHEASGFAAVCAMHAGNLLAVVESLRRKWPERDFILAADNDAQRPDNPGLTAATAAAKATGTRLAVPVFADVADKPTDFNDLQRLEGMAAVRRQIEAAEAPAETDDEFLARLGAGQRRTARHLERRTPTRWTGFPMRRRRQ